MRELCPYSVYRRELMELHITAPEEANVPVVPPGAVHHAGKQSYTQSRRRSLLTKADLVNEISEATGLTKVDTEAVVNGFIYTIGSALKRGEGIEIRGFGTFRVREKKPRLARNPRTGEKVEVPRRHVPSFKPSKELKLLVDNELSK